MDRGKYKLINGLFVINLLCSWSRKCHYREGNFKCGLQKFKMHHISVHEDCNIVF